MKKIIKLIPLLASIAIGFAFISCKCKSSNKKMLPNVSGKAGEVIVVMNSNDWGSDLGIDVRESLEADFPFLPQPEPLYSLVHLSPNAFKNMFKLHRNIIIFNVKSDIQKTGMLHQKDAWAYPQCVIQINASDTEEAGNIFDDNKDKILKIIEQAERDRVIMNCIEYEKTEISETAKRVFGGSPHFPVGYRIMKVTNNFMWVQDERQYSNQGIFIYKYPVPKDTGNVFGVENIIKQRNKFLQENVPGMRENSWMTTGTYMTPEVEYLKFRGRRFAETRGLWDVLNDYMGGPFVSHSFYGKDGRDIITVEAFVYAPKFEKRQFLRQVEAILYSFDWAKENEEIK